jgi:hypothetical protein
VSSDSLLQDVPLELKVWDYDVVSANDVVRKLKHSKINEPNFVFFLKKKHSTSSKQ